MSLNNAQARRVLEDKARNAPRELVAELLREPGIDAADLRNVAERLAALPPAEELRKRRRLLAAFSDLLSAQEITAQETRIAALEAS